jgi:hypothetical protein
LAWSAIGCLTVAIAFRTTTEAAAPSRGARPGGNLLNHLHEQHQRLQKQFAVEIEQLATSCEKKNLHEAARQIRARTVAIDTETLRLESLSKQVQPEIPLSLPPDERSWRVQLRHLNQEYAKKLFLLSRRVLKPGYPSYAYQLVREVAHFDPDHRLARGVLGYTRQGDEWVTPFAAKMLRRKYVRHEEFGWLPQSRVSRYENGERFYKRWMSADQEAEIRSDFRNAWVVQTEHYLVKTNDSLERGVEIADELEKFYGFFVQTFPGFFNTPEQMRKLFAGNSRSRKTQLHQPYEVHYFRTRDEYIRKLKNKIEQIAITDGLYYTGDRVAYFFREDEAGGSTNSTLYHEATHQILYETSSRNRAVANLHHFWIIEGIACYMESFRHANGEFSLGAADYIRFQNARDRYLSERYGQPYYVPLAAFANMSMREFQSHPEISANYSQAAGLSHFFMHAEEGRYRDALVEHLAQLYSVNPGRREYAQSLEELTGVGYAEFDRRYGEYLSRWQRALRPGPATTQ